MNEECSSLRPPAIPLVVHDPYFSVWTAADSLTDAWSSHWTGKAHSLCGIIRMDGTCFSFIGNLNANAGFESTKMRQISVEVLPTRTICRFEGGGISLGLVFLTPALPHKPDVMSRPLTYVDFEVESTDGVSHEVQLYFDIAANWTVNVPHQEVVWGRHRSNDAELLFIGSKEQDVLGKNGDDLRIDWGYLYCAAFPGQAFPGQDRPGPALPGQSSSGALSGDTDARRCFAATGRLPDRDDTDMPRAAGCPSDSPVAALAFDLGTVGEDASGAVGPRGARMMIAYDDRYSVEYRHRRLRAWWRREGGGLTSIADLFGAAIREYPAIRDECERYDAELMADLEKAGGRKYALLAALSFRQCLAAHKLVADADGKPLYFSKENFSNGCMGTVDVTYPSSPFFLLFNPGLLEAQLLPILDYARSGSWIFPFAPHDTGRYPIANGQVYGGGGKTDLNQMPVEECGNMLLLVAGLCVVREDAAFAGRYRDILSGWADYLAKHGLDPENQLCTDDFAGHLAHNANLSLKAILAVAAWSRIAGMLALADESKRFRETAESMAAEWTRMADDGDHYRLTYDLADSWSQKYNLVWDRILGLDLFPDSIAAKETAFYSTRQKKYGLPLDSRAGYTKLDWTIWSASLCESFDDFAKFVDPVFRWLNETPSRVPLTDWYDCDTGAQAGFQARSVVGGVFVKLLLDIAAGEKWRARVGAKARKAG